MSKQNPVRACATSLVLAGALMLASTPLPARTDSAACALSDCIAASTGIDEQLLRYAELYARYGLEVRADRINVYGKDFRTSSRAQLTDAEDQQHSGTAELVCPSVAGTSKQSVARSTVNYLGGGRFVGASHGVLPFDARIALGYRLLGISSPDPLSMRLALHHALKAPAALAAFEAMVSRAFAAIVPACRVYLIDREGTAIDRLTVVAYKNGTNAIGLEAHADDTLVLRTSTLSSYNSEPQASKLVAVSKTQAMHRPVSMYAFHTDLRANGKVRSHGRIRPFSPGHRHFASSRIVGQDLDTQGGSSGALVYDKTGIAICMHLGSTAGQDFQRRSYDGKDRSNYCRLITQDVVDFVYGPRGWNEVKPASLTTVPGPHLRW